MKDAVRQVLPLIEEVVREPSLLSDDRARVAWLGKEVQKRVRAASYALPAAFVSGDRLLAADDPEWYASLVRAQRNPIDEHVVPLKWQVPGVEFLKDPAAYFDGAFTAAMVAPRCLVLGTEDRVLSRLRHPCQGFTFEGRGRIDGRPFLRYAPDNLSRRATKPIRVFRLQDGSELSDLANYTMSAWEVEMARYCAFAEAFVFHRRFSATWREMLPEVAAMLRSWKSPVRHKPHCVEEFASLKAGHFDKDELEEITGLAGKLLARPSNPDAGSGKAIVLPEGNMRVTIDIVGPGNKGLLRLNIGAERSRFEFYTVSGPRLGKRSMFACGRACLDQLRNTLASKARLKLKPRLTDVKREELERQARSAGPDEARAARDAASRLGPGFGYYLEREPGMEAKDTVIEALPKVIDAIEILYPKWLAMMRWELDGPALPEAP
jgi:hypothetical protein